MKKRITPQDHSNILYSEKIPQRSPTFTSKTASTMKHGNLKTHLESINKESDLFESQITPRSRKLPDIPKKISIKTELISSSYEKPRRKGSYAYKTYLQPNLGLKEPMS